MQKLKSQCTPEEWAKVASFKKRWEKRRTPEQLEYRKKWMQAYRERVPKYNFQYMVSKYGITPEQYEEMKEVQDNKCKICEQPPTTKRLFVDHCHKTGKVRGLLCIRCNAFLGYWENFQHLMSSVEAYLGA